MEQLQTTDGEDGREAIQTFRTLGKQNAKAAAVERHAATAFDPETSTFTIWKDDYIILAYPVLHGAVVSFDVDYRSEQEVDMTGDPDATKKTANGCRYSTPERAMADLSRLVILLADAKKGATS